LNLSEGKDVGLETNHPPPYSAEVKEPWNYTSTTEQVIMA